MGFLLQIRMSWLRFRKGVGGGPECWCCELAERAFKTGRSHKLAVQAAYILGPAGQQVVGFCLAIWVYAGVNFHFHFSPDGEAIGVLTSINNELPARAFETGCWCWVPALVL